MEFSEQEDIDYQLIYQALFKGFVYSFYGLFIVVDGLRFPDSYLTQMLTFPHLIAGLALARVLCNALTQHYYQQVSLFFMGLIVLGCLV